MELAPPCDKNIANNINVYNSRTVSQTYSLAGHNTSAITKSTDGRSGTFSCGDTSTASRLICNDSVQSFIFTCQTVCIVWTSTCSAASSTSYNKSMIIAIQIVTYANYTAHIHSWMDTYQHSFLMSQRNYPCHNCQQYTHWGMHHVGSMNYCRSNNVLDWQVLNK